MSPRHRLCNLILHRSPKCLEGMQRLLSDWLYQSTHSASACILTPLALIAESRGGRWLQPPTIPELFTVTSPRRAPLDPRSSGPLLSGVVSLRWIFGEIGNCLSRVAAGHLTEDNIFMLISGGKKCKVMSLQACTFPPSFFSRPKGMCDFKHICASSLKAKKKTPAQQQVLLTHVNTI